MEFAKDKLEWIEYDLFRGYPEIAQATFLRHGGVSKPPFHSLNLSNSVGDHLDTLKVNRDLVHKQLGIAKIVYAKQVHKEEVIQVRKRDKTYKEADALITQDPGLGLAITHADCQAAIFFDPVTKSIGACHAGWKGLILNIYEKTVQALHQSFGCNPQDLIVAISPSLCEMHAEFIHYKEEIPEKYWSFKKKDPYFDLRGMARMQLNGAGIPDRQIEFSEMCTFCNSKDCYSHRREKKTGRHATIIGLKSL